MNAAPVTVMITTRNRAVSLVRTLDALAALKPAPDEVLVTLDGCTDESERLVRERFPGVTLLVNATGLGSIPSRDRMVRLARNPLVLSLDDDSHPLDDDFLSRAAAFFERDERLALLAFPQRSEEFPESLEQTDFGPDLEIASYASSGVMLRVSAYRALPGYATVFGHMFEEPDYALQCLAAGWRARLHAGLVIRHHYSGLNRNEIRIHQLHARNESWSVLLRCPSPWWPFVALRRAAGQFAYACKRGPGWIVREPLWWWRALAGARAILRERRPVTWRAYRYWRRLLRAPRVLT